jgi:VIT1/CCC1 family predicted Fe2+/Mn2+ transporter
MASQIGMFFLFIGLILLLIFGAVASAGEYVVSMCLAGSALFALGATIMWKNRKPPTPSDRFHTVKRISEKRKNRDH